jgi:hypothetical protein
MRRGALRKQGGGTATASIARATAALGLCGLVLGAAGRSALAEDAEFTVHVGYDEFQEEVRPLSRRGSVPQKIAFTPIGERTLRVVYVRTHPFRTEAETSEVTLGVVGEGRFRNVQWSRPGDGTTYVRVQKTPSYTMNLTVTIQDRTCQAAIRFDLLPGFTEYMMFRAKNPSEKAYNKTLRADRVKCWIGDFTVS